MADGIEPLSKSSYAPTGSIDRGRVLRHHEQGATIILRAAQRWSPALRRICAALEWDFGFPTQANVYLTPAGHKSTPPHWDTHDLFIAQIEGTKTWRFYSSDYPLPLAEQRFDGITFSAGPLQDQLQLKPGDVLYLPRGAIHEPVADSYSVHVSFGVLVSRWSDVLAELVTRVAQSVPGLRRAVPLPPGVFQDPSALADEMYDLLEALADRSACRETVAAHVAALLRGHTDIRQHQFAALNRKHDGPSDGYRRAASRYVIASESDARLELAWKDGRFSVPSRHRKTVAEIVDGRRFEIQPASEMFEEQQAFCETLLKEGLLERVRSSDHPAAKPAPRLRNATLEDIPFILEAEIETQLTTFGHEETRDQGHRRRVRLRSAIASGSVAIAEFGGTAGAYCWLEPRATDQWQLVDFYVASEYRGSGVAGWLLTAMIATRVASRPASIELTIGERNERSIRFFRKYGAVASGESSADGLRNYVLSVE